MSQTKLYDERAVVLAFVDAQRPPYPHEDFRTHRVARLRALERVYSLELSSNGVADRKRASLFMLFGASARAYVDLKGPRADVLEGGLFEVTLDRLGEVGAELRVVEQDLMDHLERCRETYLDYMTRLFIVLWGPIARPCSADDLRAHGFDETKAPKDSDYYDFM